MTCRELKPSDIPKLEEIYRASGYCYDFPDLSSPRVLSVRVLVDDDDEVIMAALAESIPQLYLLTPKVSPPALLGCVKQLHAALRDDLKSRGYHEANAFLPPEIDERFGRWLVRRFGWVRSWKCWGVQF